MVLPCACEDLCGRVTGRGLYGDRSYSLSLSELGGRLEETRLYGRQKLRQIVQQMLGSRGAGIGVVWPQFLIVALIGGLFLCLALLRFRKVTAAAV
jgi:hypothetical protein